MSRSIELAKELELQTLKALSENGGELTRSRLLEILREKIDFDDWAKGVYEKTGYVRWESILQFYSIYLVKAGFITKSRKNSTWYITEEGEKALKLGKDKIFEEAQKRYRQWKRSSMSECLVETTEASEEQIEESAQTAASVLEDAKNKSYESFERFITKNFDPYEFQDLCAALFRGMGYYTPFVAPKGKDGGVDIIAYKDPIGSTYPHIKIQVKYRQDAKASSQEVQQLKGVLTGNDMGVFISLAGFSPDARNVARNSNSHIDLIDLKRFIELWQEFHDKMADGDKALMQITPVYFIAEND